MNDLQNDLKEVVSYLADEDQHFWENCQCSDKIKDSGDPDKCKCKENKNHIYQTVMRLQKVLETGEIKPYAVNFATATNWGFEDDWHYFIDKSKAKAYLKKQLKDLKEVLADLEDGAIVEYITPAGVRTRWHDNGEGKLEEY